MSVLTLVLASPAFAAEKENSIRVLYMVDDSAVSDVVFNLYSLAQVSQSGELMWADNVPASVTGEESTGELNFVLLSAAGGGTYVSQTKTDASGYATFTGVTEGIYIIRGEEYTKDGVQYSPVPAVIQVPFFGEDGVLSADAHVEVKHTFKRLPTVEPPVETPKPEPTPIPVPSIPETSFTPVFERDRLPEWEPLEDYTPPTVVYTENWDDLEEIPDFDVPLGDLPKLPQTGLLQWPIPVLSSIGIVFCLTGCMLVLCSLPKRRQLQHVTNS